MWDVRSGNSQRLVAVVFPVYKLCMSQCNPGAKGSNEFTLL